jgi:hypothetical protein
LAIVAGIGTYDGRDRKAVFKTQKKTFIELWLNDCFPDYEPTGS